MAILKKWFNNPWIFYPVVSLFFTVLLPILMTLLGASVTMRVGILFLIVDFIVAGWFGYRLRKMKQPWYFLLIFPLLFALMVFIRYADYSYWLVGAYLVVEFLFYSWREN